MTGSVIIVAALALVAVLLWLAVRDRRRGEHESYVLGRWRRHRDG
jgi:hypothetical protein